MVIVIAVLVAIGVGIARLRRRRTQQPAEPPDRNGPTPDPAATRRGEDADQPVPPTFSAPVPTFRVVALGVSGSGKTVLLSSMFHELSYATKTRSYFLDTNAQDRLRLNNLYEEVCDPSRPWPRATGRSIEETKEYVFRCVGRDGDGRRCAVAQVSYLDFAGALLEDAAHATSGSFDRLHDAIRHASALLILLDGRRVRQLLAGEPGGRTHFDLTMAPTLGLAQEADCPLHFVITKWDLLQDFGPLHRLDEPARLDAVVEALLRHPRIGALVHGGGRDQVVRMIPVSSVGPAFVEMDGQGHVVKRPDGAMHPTNVEAPLSAVVPDFFRQVESRLGEETTRSLHAAMRGRRGDPAGTFVRVLAALLAGPAGTALQATLHGFVGPAFGDGVYTFFLDWTGRAQMRRNQAATQLRDQAEREIATVRAVRARVLDDFVRAVYRLEDRYPRSLLRSAHWGGTS